MGSEFQISYGWEGETFHGQSSFQFSWLWMNVIALALSFHYISTESTMYVTF